MPNVKIYAHKAVGLEVDLASKKVNVPAGGMVQDTLTGDHIGTVQASLDTQRLKEKLPLDLAGGHVEVMEDIHHVPAGSKKWIGLVRSREHKPSTQELRQAAVVLKAVDEKQAGKMGRRDLWTALNLDQEAFVDDAPVPAPPAAMAASGKPDKTEKPTKGK